MKNSFFSFVAMFICLLAISSCGDSGDNSLPVNITGTITNPVANEVIISKAGTEHKILLDSLQSFESNLDLDEGYYTLTHGRENTTIYLTPGDKVNITLDTRNFDESLKYEGSNATINTYLAAKALKMEPINSKMRDDFILEESEFIQKMVAYETELKSFLNEAGLGKEFSELEGKNILYDIINRRMKYETYHQYFTNNNSFNVSEEFARGFENIDFTNEEYYLTIPSYHELANNYFLTGDAGETVERLKSTESQLIRDKIMKDLVQWISPGTDNLKTLVSDMKNMTSDSTLVLALDAKYNEMKDLGRGNDSPGFNFANIDGQLVSLNDLKGKNVYVDVWATWCGPCKREIPFLKELESEYHDKNIEFVSISVDVPKDMDKWKQMVADQDLKGIQLISDNGWDTEFVNKYLIRGIPRFILIDAEGKIVNADAPRPSSNEKIRGMIESLSI